MRSPRMILLAVALSLAPLANAVARDDNEGVVVRRPSITRRLVSEGTLEVHLRQYQGLLRAAQAKSALAPQDHPQVVRLGAISQKIIPHVAKWNEEAKGLEVGSEFDRLTAGQRVLHARGQDCVFPRHSRKAGSDR